MRFLVGARSHRRTGATLIETTVAVGVTTMILSVVFSVAAMALRATQSGTRHLVECAAVARIGRMFRDDVRAAVAAATDAPANGMPRRLVLDLPNERRVEYRVADGRLLVVRQQKGKATSRDTVALAAGRLGAGADARVSPGSLGQPQSADGWFRIAPTPGGELVSLHLSDRRDGASRPVLAIEAVRGADHRFDKRSGARGSARTPVPGGAAP